MAGVVVFAICLALVFLAASTGRLNPAVLNVDFGDPVVRMGVALCVAGVLVALVGFWLVRLIRRNAQSERAALPFQAIDLINAPDAQERLGRTICLGIDAYRAAAGPRAEHMLTVTMVALANEYATAETSDARIAALKMLNELHARVSRTIRPWWLDYERLIARIVALTSVLASVVAVVEGLRRLIWVPAQSSAAAKAER